MEGAGNAARSIEKSEICEVRQHREASALMQRFSSRSRENCERELLFFLSNLVDCEKTRLLPELELQRAKKGSTGGTKNVS